MLQNYSQLLERISRSTSLSVDEIERRIEAKRAKLSGLISKEGAAQVVAAELGVNFDKEKMKISELLGGMKKVNLVGKIIQMFPVREYNRNGRKGKIGSFILADETSNVRVILWDTNHIQLIEGGKLREGAVVDITNASMRNSELHLTGFSDIKVSAESLENIKTERIFNEKKILEVKQGESVRFRAFIVQMFEPRFFMVCPACGKKVSETGECQEHGKVAPEKRHLVNLVLDDGSSTIRAVLFSEQASQLLGEGIENSEIFLKKRQELLGEELYFSGQVRQNKLFQNLEFYVEETKSINIDKLIEDLEKG